MMFGIYAKNKISINLEMEMIRLKMYKYNHKYDIINGDIIALKIITFNNGNDVEIPYYWYDIIEKKTNRNVGKISIRLGCNYHSYYNGNIGYEIDEEYRGNNYAYIASKMVINIAKDYGMKEIFLTCEKDNIASYKTIEKLGAELIEIVVPPKDYFGYYDGIDEYRIYKKKLY